MIQRMKVELYFQIFTMIEMKHLQGQPATMKVERFRYPHSSIENVLAKYPVK